MENFMRADTRTMEWTFKSCQKVLRLLCTHKKSAIDTLGCLAHSKFTQFFSYFWI